MPESRGLEPPYTDDELAGIVGNLITTAGDHAQTFIEENRREAWAYYLGRRGDDSRDVSATTDRTGYFREGASAAVSEDVADTVEALMAIMMPVFGSDVPAEFEPMGPDDEESASAESDAVANIIMERNAGFTVIYSAIKDCLLLRNGTIKAWIDENTITERRRFKDISDEDLALFVSAVPEGIDVAITSREGTKASIRLSRTDREPRVKAIEQSNFLVDPNHDSIFVNDVHFCAERKFPSRSELIQDGLDKKQINDLPAFTNDTSIDSTAKNIEGISADLERPTHDSDLIEVYEAYVRIDLSGDGISELTRFLWSNNEILDQVPAEFIPYATGTCWMVQHRYSGLSVYDKLRQSTDIKSRTLQQYLDNLTTNNSARTAVNENTVNMDDMLAGRPNAILRNDGPPADDLMPFPTNDTGQSSQSLLDYMDKVIAQRSGAALALQQPQDQLVKAGITAQAADRQMSSSEQQAAMIARTIAETLVRSLFLLVHNMLRLQFPEPIMLNRSGQWAPVNPSEWQPRTRVNVKVGLSPSERSRKAQSLQQTIQQQLGLLQGGGNGVIVDLNGIHRALLDWSSSVDLDNAEKYYLDPESQQSQQAAAAMAQKSEAQRAAELEALTSEAQAQALNAQLDHQTEQQKLQFDYFKTILEAQVREIESIREASVEASSQVNGGGGSVGGAES
jgi:hypothetical protein